MLLNIPDKIFLIGFMGSGKSHWGRHLALHLHHSFFDLDKGIEIATHQTVAEIFDKEGAAFFRQKETEVLHSALQYPKFVMSCGGGTPCFNDNMKWMLQQGQVIWLCPPTSILAKRLVQGKDKRPLIKDAANEAEIEQILISQREKREPYYSQATHVITNPFPELKTFLNLWE